jgi:tRNA/rRNA methyltransferase
MGSTKKETAQPTPASLVVPESFDHLRVVLVRPRNPLNIGAAARAMSNFGFTHLRLVEPWEPSFEGARSAVGAAELLQQATVYASVAEAVADCHLVVGTTAVGERGLEQPLQTVAQAAPRIRRALGRGPVAVLFGSEKSGLTKQDLDHCQLIVKIPTRDAHISMNLGQAVSICMYELARTEARAVAPAEAKPATGEEVERITSVLFEALQVSGHVPQMAEGVTLEKTRRLVRRLQANEKDATALLGMLRKILWKLKHPGKTS